MENTLYKKLVIILREKRENRFKMLKTEICTDEDINGALEIAKHESSNYLPRAALLTVLAVLIISLFNNSLALRLSKYTLLIPFLFTIVLIYFVYPMMNNFRNWKEVYYCLIELRRQNTKQSEISTLDMTISGVEAINSRIEVLEKNICTKLDMTISGVEALNSRIDVLENKIMRKLVLQISDRDIIGKEHKSMYFAIFLSLTILLFNRTFDYIEYMTKTVYIAGGDLTVDKLSILFLVFVLWLFVLHLCFAPMLEKLRLKELLGKLWHKRNHD